jgi:DNA-directed RNA polymerase specialized sigma24 family protein
MTTTPKELAETLLDMREYAAHFAGDDADDLIQDTYLRAYEKQHLFTGGSLAAWLKTMMQRVHWNKIRLRGNQRVRAACVDIESLDILLPADDKSESYGDCHRVLDLIVLLTSDEAQALQTLVENYFETRRPPAYWRRYNESTRLPQSAVLKSAKAKLNEALANAYSRAA